MRPFNLHHGLRRFHLREARSSYLFCLFFLLVEENAECTLIISLSYSLWNKSSARSLRVLGSCFLWPQYAKRPGGRTGLAAESEATAGQTALLLTGQQVIQAGRRGLLMNRQITGALNYSKNIFLGLQGMKNLQKLGLCHLTLEKFTVWSAWSFPWGHPGRHL